jgi:enoyl-CoA hydratase/carnithine racemase
MAFQYLSKERRGDVFVITMRRAPENRLNVQFCQELTRAYHEIQLEFGPDSEGAVILQGSDEKFFCTVRSITELSW